MHLNKVVKEALVNAHDDNNNVDMRTGAYAGFHFGRGCMASAGARAYNGGLGAVPPAGSRGRAPGGGSKGEAPLS